MGVSMVDCYNGILKSYYDVAFLVLMIETLEDYRRSKIENCRVDIYNWDRTTLVYRLKILEDN